MATVCRYKAFISYSHTDRAQAKRLLRSLENYRLPKHLRRQVAGDTEIVPTRVGTLFRDREELPAAEDLTAEVKKALTESEFMIVLCSPAAAASRWVNREIIEFKKLNGEGKILSVILSGEPFATDKGQPGEECFPPALRFRLAADGRLTTTPAEPLAADMRRGGDGYRRALLKLVAGLLGIGLDALIERDLQRKMRRVTAVTAASLIAVLGMGALTYEAITARQEAEHHRNEAEGLIEFMLTDLRLKLEKIGHVKVLEAVGKAAADFHPSENLTNLSDDAAGRKARAMHFLGEIDERRGDLSLAERRFKAAALATAELLARDTDNTQRIFEHAQSIYWVGRSEWRQGHYELAEPYFVEYDNLALKLIAIDPEDFMWRMETAYSSKNLAALYLQSLGRPELANEYNMRAMAILEELSTDAYLKASFREQALHEYVDTFAWQADFHEILGPIALAKTYRSRQQNMLAEQLRLDPSDTRKRADLIACHVALSRLAAYGGNLQKAEGFLYSANETANLLLAKGLGDQILFKQAARISLELSDLYLSQGAIGQAVKYLGEAETRLAEMTDVNDPRWRQQTQDHVDLLGNLIALENGSEPKSTYRSLEELIAGVRAEDQTIDGFFSAIRAAYAVRQDPDGSQLSDQTVRDIKSAFEKFKHRMRPREKLVLIEVFSHIGETETALSLASDLTKLGVSITLHRKEPIP